MNYALNYALNSHSKLFKKSFSATPRIGRTAWGFRDRAKLRHLLKDDQTGNRVPAVIYQVRRSLAAEGKPGAQLMTLIRDAARQRRPPQTYINFLDAIEVCK